MFLSKCYKYEHNGIVGVGLLPEGATVLEEMDILNADEGYELVKDDERIGGSIWLKDGDTQDNYSELTINEGE